MATIKQIKWQEENQLELEKEYDLFIMTSTNPASELSWQEWIESKYKEFKTKASPCV